jgi:hypothetical protein
VSSIAYRCPESIADLQFRDQITGKQENKKTAKRTYPFVLSQISILIICRRQVRSRRTYGQSSFGVEVLRFESISIQPMMTSNSHNQSLRT